MDSQLPRHLQPWLVVGSSQTWEIQGGQAGSPYNMLLESPSLPRAVWVLSDHLALVAGCSSGRGPRGVCLWLSLFREAGWWHLVSCAEGRTTCSELPSLFDLATDQLRAGPAMLTWPAPCSGWGTYTPLRFEWPTGTATVAAGGIVEQRRPEGKG